MESLSKDTKDFWIDPSIRYLDSPTSLEFLRDAVCCYHPVIIRGAMNDWIAYNKWNVEYLKEKIGENTPIKVNITPNGLADSIQSIGDDFNEVFTYPLECTMTSKTFFEMMISPEFDDAVPYLSQQNDNLRKEFLCLCEDIPTSICFADEAFNPANVEAVNLWIGDERSISSLHKDHYENLYAVIEGEKTFFLAPPTDIAFLDEFEYDTMTYVHKDHSSSSTVISDRIKKSSLELTPNEIQNKIFWINDDPSNVQYNLLSPICCKVKSGEILYIPSMWYHRVSQSTLTIAVNYWYEQKFDFRYVFYNHVKNSKNIED